MYPVNHAIAILKCLERFSPIPYREPDGSWSIGYGENMGKTITISSMTRQEAVVRLGQKIMPYALAVDSAISVPISAEIFTALVDFTYNEGIAAFQKSTLLERLNAGDYAGAARELVYTDADGTLHGWIFAKDKILPGLVERRYIEQELFLSGIIPGIAGTI